MNTLTPPGKQSAMELLAPAGSTAAFVAALEAGADAVYVGAPGLSARALRKEFTLNDIAAMTDYAHERGKRLYVAMNSLVKEEEVHHALGTLSVLEQIGPDALIVQDMGLAFLARKFFPQLVLHASTLMSVHNSQGAQFLTSEGFERVVLARELSLEEIGTIGRESKAELEIFIHGAMCFSYSGLCLFSSLHGGKSSLRGRCVQPCRRQYRFVQRKGKTGRGAKERKGEFFFSMNDLSGIDYLSELEKLGVVSLKIEGRLKPVEYVKNTVQAYRLCLDGLQAGELEKRRIRQEAGRLLEKAMGRRSAGGFFTREGGELISPSQSGSAGVFVGQARSVFNRKGGGERKERLFSVRLKADIKLGDRLRFQNEALDVRESFTLKTMKQGSRNIRQAAAGKSVQLVIPVTSKDRKRHVDKGLLFRVDVGARRRSEGSIAGLKSGVKKETVACKKHLDDIVRQICWAPDAAAAGRSRKAAKEDRGGKGAKSRPNWWVRLHVLPPARQRYPVSPTKVVVSLTARNLDYVRAMGDSAAALYANLVWALPSVVHERDLPWYKEAVSSLVQLQFRQFQLGHVSQAAFFHRFTGEEAEFALYTDYQANILNASALAYGHALGLQGMQFSLETDRETLQRALAARRRCRSGAGTMGAMQVGMYVYGRPPLFTARADSPHLHTRRRVVSPKNEQFSIEPGEDVTQVRSTQPFVLLPHVREMMEAGVDYFVVDLSSGPLRKETAEFSLWLHGKNDQQNALTGNYLMGLL